MDLSINNVRLFDGSAVREGRCSVGIVGNKITSVGSATVHANREIDAGGKVSHARAHRLPHPSAQYVDGDR
jgi:hypothetical protein